MTDPWHGSGRGSTPRRSTILRAAKNALRSLGEEGHQSIDFPRQFYTGFSEDIDGRLDDHNKGKSVHTNKFKPWKMIFYCAFNDKKKALEFEKYLKTASGIAFRNKRLI